jgi:hypothetical protein
MGEGSSSDQAQALPEQFIAKEYLIKTKRPGLNRIVFI